MKNCFSKLALRVAVLTGVIFASAAQAAGPDPDRYIVSFLDAAKGRSALRASGANVLRELPNQGAVAARIPARALKSLLRNPNIEYIEVDALRYPMSETVPWGIPTIQADLLGDLNTGNTMVCIIDSGYSNGHEDLPTLISTHATYNSGTGDPLAPASLCHHGTHVAGTIAAVKNNGVGVVGVNPNKKVALHIVKVFEDDPTSASGCGWGYSSDLVGALDACVAAKGNKQLIVNMSLGGPIKSRTEQRAFGNAFNAGVLSVAAAGNDGNTRHSYPASYDSVISVAAVDSSLVVADFSQQTTQVELAGPGVAVRSTVTMGTGTEESLSVGGSGFEATGLEGSAQTPASGPLYRCHKVDGLGSPGDCADGPAGMVCLISRGDITFAEKAIECESAGGVGVVIFNNADALFSGTFGDTVVSIPGVGVSGIDGGILEGMTGQSATVTTTQGNYAYYDGTSMATPHVAGAAALVWSQDSASTCSNADIRNALDSSALPLGPEGRDNAYGYGLVQASDAVAFLGDNCGGGGGGGGGSGQCALLPVGASCSADSDCCTSTCKGKPGTQTCK